MSTPEPVSFGPAGRQWHFSKGTGYAGGTFDLSYGSSQRFKFNTQLVPGVTVPRTLGAGDVEIAVNPTATALVIVDMQNFFLDPKCRAHPNGLAAVGPTIEAIKKCRDVGVQVIWLNWGLTDSDLEKMPAGVQRGFLHNDMTAMGGLGSDLGDGKGRTLCAESWNADIYSKLKPYVEPSDLHCAKNRMSGLWNAAQPLFKTLVDQKITTLLFAGVNTDQCVLGTLADAYNNGWDCVMVTDACATTTIGAREVTFCNAAACYGFVTDSQRLSGGQLE